MRTILPWTMALLLPCGAAAATTQSKATQGKATQSKATQGKATESKATALKCVGLYSETDAGYVSYRVGTGAWTVIKVGDTIPANAEIRVNVDRDWVELTPSDNPNAVYEITGSESGDGHQEGGGHPEGQAEAGQLPEGDRRQARSRSSRTSWSSRSTWAGRSTPTRDGDDKDIKYGDVLDIKGKVTIIAINNTITLMNASGKVTTVIGPLKFDVEKVLKNEKLYKFLNVPR